jgi:prepilin-type N-terminal cleavage/methylation domain-containing protein
MGQKLSSENGFTLIEVIVALVIITALAASVGPLLVSSVQNIKWAEERMQQLYELRGQMERHIASLDGIPLDMVVRGFDEQGNRRQWTVEGVLVTVPAAGSGKEADLVSFVVPKE